MNVRRQFFISRSANGKAWLVMEVGRPDRLADYTNKTDAADDARRRATNCGGTFKEPATPPRWGGGGAA